MVEKERKKLGIVKEEGREKVRLDGVHLGRSKINIDNFKYYYEQIYKKENMTAVEALEELVINKSTFIKEKLDMKKINSFYG